MQVLDKITSRKKIWFYKTFDMRPAALGGQQRSEDEIRDRLDREKLGTLASDLTKPNSKKAATVQAGDLAKFVMGAAPAADRALALGNIDGVKEIARYIKTALSSPLMRPPPDERVDRDLEAAACRRPSPEATAYELASSASQIAWAEHEALKKGELGDVSPERLKTAAEKLKAAQMVRDQRSADLDKMVIADVKAARAQRSAMEATLMADRQGLLVMQHDLLKRAVAAAPGDVALRDQLDEAELDLALGGMKQEDPFRAKLAEADVRKTMKALMPELGKVVAPEYRDAMMSRLGSKLTGIIDEMVAEAVLNYAMPLNSKGVRAPAPDVSYAAMMTNLVNKGGAPLFNKFPGLKERIELEATQFQATMTQLFKRVTDDSADVSQTMFGGADVQLKDIVVADSDPHNGGHRVTILTFVGDDGTEHKVVNKPRDIRVDAKFVGATGKTGIEASLSERTTGLLRKAEATRLQKAADTDALLDVLTEEIRKAQGVAPSRDQLALEIAGKSVAELQALVGDGEKDRVKALAESKTIDPAHIKTASDTVPALPTYKFMDKVDDDGHPYGWVEFIEHGRAEDCILDKDKAKKFYDQAGQLGALCFLCGVEDVHQGNILIRHGQPVLTDLEIAFSSKKEPSDPGFDPKTSSPDQINQIKKYIDGKIDNTMLHKGLLQGSQAAHYGCGYVVNDRIGRRTPGTELTENTVFLEGPDGKLVSQMQGMASQFSDEFQAGFARVCEAFGSEVDLDDNDAFIDSFAGMDVRFHPLATAAQLDIRRGAVLKGYADSIEDEKNRLFGTDGQGTNGALAKNDLMKERIDDDPKLTACLSSMASDLAKRDVAYYTQTLGTPTVKHNGKTPIKTKSGEDVLPNNGLAVAKRNLRLMVHQRELLKTRASTIIRPVNFDTSLEMKELKAKLLEERDAV